jgi:serine protease Do
MLGDPSSRIVAAARAGKVVVFTLLVAMSGAPLIPGGMNQSLAVEVNAVGVSAPTGFAEIVERVRPAVVGIRVKTDQRTSDVPRTRPIPQGSLLDRFFRQFGIQITPDQGSESDISVGAGFLISGDGDIVTNEHVVASGIDIEVTLDDGKSYSGRLIGADPQTDLALIKIHAAGDLPYVRLAATEPRIGEWVLPIGNPFGFGGTVTAGIVSARGRDIGEEPYSDFIQIDAPVNKGNSGGPTFNVRGEVVGVNTAIYSPSGGSVGVAFDIPAETVKAVVQQLREKGRVTRGWVGVYLQEVTPRIADALDMAKAQGALVAQLDLGGPAAKQGIEAGDVIVFLNEHEVTNPRDFARTMATIAPGSAVNVRVLRNGQALSLMITAGELSQAKKGPSDKQARPGEEAALGLTLAPATLVPGAGESGIVVMEINPESGAAAGGLQVGDIVLNIGGRPVAAVADFNRMVGEARAQTKRTLLIRVRRADAMNFVAVPLD